MWGSSLRDLRAAPLLFLYTAPVKEIFFIPGFSHIAVTEADTTSSELMSSAGLFVPTAGSAASSLRIGNLALNFTPTSCEGLTGLSKCNY